MGLIGQGVVALSNKVGGADRLKELLGGAVSFVRKAQGSFFGCGSEAAAWAISGLFSGGTVEFYNGAFNSWPGASFTRGTTVHELAHIIDFNNGIWDQAVSHWGYQGFSDAFATGSKYSLITDYSDSYTPEYWAEAVADWVYGPSYKAYEYKSKTRANLSGLQADWLSNVLRGGGP